MPAVVWSPVSQAQFDVRHWDDEDQAVVYVVASGDTHLIDLPALDLLRSLQEAPASQTALCNAMTLLYPEDDGETVKAYVDASLQTLLDIGLVVRVERSPS